MSAIIREAGPFRIRKAYPARSRREHQSIEAAETEAKRLQALNPEQSFVIEQEVARVVPHG